MNCEVESDLSCTNDYVLIEHHNKTTGVVAVITSTKTYVLVITLPTGDNIKLLENFKQGFKSTNSWNNYRSVITKQPKSNNLDYMIHPTFRNINTFFVLSFKNGDNDSYKRLF